MLPSGTASVTWESARTLPKRTLTSSATIVGSPDDRGSRRRVSVSPDGVASDGGVPSGGGALEGSWVSTTTDILP
jgi:hypothetical protein